MSPLLLRGWTCKAGRWPSALMMFGQGVMSGCTVFTVLQYLHMNRHILVENTYTHITQCGSHVTIRALEIYSHWRSDSMHVALIIP